MKHRVSLILFFRIFLAYILTKTPTSLESLTKIYQKTEQTTKNILQNLKKFNLILEIRKEKRTYYIPNPDLLRNFDSFETISLIEFFQIFFDFLTKKT